MSGGGGGGTGGTSGTGGGDGCIGTMCNGACADLYTDDNNCGGCGLNGSG
jgi:hypothetical protein